MAKARINNLKRNGLAFKLFRVGRNAARKIDPERYRLRKWKSQPSPALRAAWTAIEKYISINFRRIKRKRTLSKNTNGQ